MCDPVSLTVAAIGTAGTVASASAQRSAARTASNTARDAADQQVQLQREAMQRADELLTPYSGEGAQARALRNALLGIQAPQGQASTTLAQAMEAYQASPFYATSQTAVARALNAQAGTNAARGSTVSGKAARAGAEIGNDLSQRGLLQYLASIGNVADTGFTADTGRASAGQNFANTSGGAIRDAASIASQAQLARGQATAEGISDATGLAAYFLSQRGARPATQATQRSGVYGPW